MLTLLESRGRQLSSKEEPSSWTIHELKELFFDVVSSTSGILCFFLDGLDEIHPDVKLSDFFRLVEELRSSPKIKLCVSTRPEEPILARRLLQQCPKIHLHDLTEDDIMKFVDDFIAEMEIQVGEIEPYRKRRLRDEFHTKPDGVFLWVHLACRQLGKDLRHDSTWKHIETIVADLPPQLSDLYTQMLSRTMNRGLHSRNDFLQSSAFYFNIILAAKEFTRFSPGFNISLAEVTLTDSRDMRSDCLASLWDKATFHKRCWKVKKMVEERCAGLVDFVEDRRRTNPDPSQIFPTLFHRTFVDFLTSDPDGLSYLQHDITSDEKRYVIIVESILAAWCKSRSKCDLEKTVLFIRSHIADEATQDRLLTIWSHLFDQDSRRSVSSTGLIASYGGPLTLIERYLKENAEVATSLATYFSVPATPRLLRDTNGVQLLAGDGSRFD